jgi:hypothetical protein
MDEDDTLVMSYVEVAEALGEDSHRYDPDAPDIVEAHPLAWPRQE